MLMIIVLVMISIYDILDIHKYLMGKNSINDV